MKVRFERASTEDADEIMVVQNAAFEADLNKYGECPACIPNRERMIERISSCLSYKIMLECGEVIGSIEVRRRNDFHCHLNVLGVHPDHQNKGIGTLAIQFIIASHPESVLWSLVTPKDNPHSRHLYEKMGFVESGEIVSPGGVTLIAYELLRRDALVASTAGDRA